jgi:hypothetical protein
MQTRRFQSSKPQTFQLANFGAAAAPAIPAGASQQQIDAIVGAQMRPPAEDEGYEEYIAYFKQAAPALNTLLFGDDPRVKAAVLKTKLRAAKISAKKYKGVPIVGNYFDQQVRQIQAQLSVESKKAEVAEASEGLNLAIKAGIGLIVALGAVTMLTYINLIRAQTKAVASKN